MTRSEIQRIVTDISARDLGGVVSRMRRAADASERIHISSWTRDDGCGGSTHPRPVYAMGAKPDAQKPPALAGREYSKRSRDARAIGRRTAKSVPVSVFDLARFT